MKKRFLTHRITLALALGALVLPGCVWALPQGGTVVTGNGSYTTGSDKMDITGSGNMSVKWDSFNVADNEAVNFKGMNAILNYVTGKQGSEIYGALNGEGVHVFLINPNGVLFGKTAQVNVGALTVSTKTLADVDGTLQNFKNTGAISAFGTAGDAVLINMGKLEADTLHFEGSRIILDTDNVTLGGNGFDGSRAVINGDYANDNVILGYTAYEDGSYAGKDKTFAVNDGAQQVNGYMWVEDAAQLQDINTNLKGNYALKNDIDAGVIANFVPIGNDSNNFNGKFDGLGKNIKNITVNGGNGNYKGLFGQTAKGSILRNFSLTNIYVTGYQGVGSVVGQNRGILENIIVDGQIAGKSKYAGGITGINYGVINGVQANIILLNYAGGYSGGITGYNVGTIKNVDVNVNLQGNGVGLGGVAGNNGSTGTITDVKVRGTVDAGNNSAVGGIAGANTGSIKSSYNYATVNGNSTVGGIVGQNNKEITSSSNYGTVQGNEMVGGICGQNKTNGNVSDVENFKAVSGARAVGGIIGENSGTVVKAVNKGSVSVINGISTGNSYYIGGILGSNDADGENYVSDLRNEGEVTGYSYVGGVIGCNASGKAINDVANEGNVSGLDSVGGILGYYYCDDDMVLGNAKNSGDIKGRTAVGGIVGMGGGVSMSGPPSAGEGCVSINNAVNSGSVTGSGNSVGGIIGVGTSSKSIDKVTNTGTVQGTDQVGGIIGNSVEGVIKEALNLGQVIATGEKVQYCGGIVGWGPLATVSDSAVYATTDKAGNAYDTSKYNDKGVAMTYAEIFPAPPEPPPEPPILPDDKQNVTQLPEFEENYRSSSASVSAELHTPVMVSPVAENINSGSGSLEVHDGESTFGGFSNTLGAADNVLSAETEAEHGAAGLSSPSSSDEPGGSRAGSGAGSDNVVNGEDEGDQEEQNNEKI